MTARNVVAVRWSCSDGFIPYMYIYIEEPREEGNAKIVLNSNPHAARKAVRKLC